MNCRYVDSRLSCYIDGELTGREMILVRRHLDECAACRKELDNLTATKQVLGSLCCPPIRPGFEVELRRIVLNCGDRSLSLLERMRACARAPWLSWAVGATAFAGAFAILFIPEQPELFTKNGVGVSTATMESSTTPYTDEELNRYFRDHHETQPGPYQIYLDTDVVPATMRQSER